jgi:hypothetical protein
MASFLLHLVDNKVAIDDEVQIHKYLFGQHRILRRGRYFWRIGILRQIIKQRLARGIKQKQLLPYRNLLIEYENLFKIKRSIRLWYYMYDSLRFKRNADQGKNVRRIGLARHSTIISMMKWLMIENKIKNKEQYDSTYQYQYQYQYQYRYHQLCLDLCFTNDEGLQTSKPKIFNPRLPSVIKNEQFVIKVLSNIVDTTIELIMEDTINNAYEAHTNEVCDQIFYEYLCDVIKQAVIPDFFVSLSILEQQQNKHNKHNKQKQKQKQYPESILTKGANTNTNTHTNANANTNRHTNRTPYKVSNEYKAEYKYEDVIDINKEKERKDSYFSISEVDVDVHRGGNYLESSQVSDEQPHSHAHSHAHALTSENTNSEVKVTAVNAEINMEEEEGEYDQSLIDALADAFDQEHQLGVYAVREVASTGSYLMSTLTVAANDTVSTNAYANGYATATANTVLVNEETIRKQKEKEHRAERRQLKRENRLLRNMLQRFDPVIAEVGHHLDGDDDDDDLFSSEDEDEDDNDNHNDNDNNNDDVVEEVGDDEDEDEAGNTNTPETESGSGAGAGAGAACDKDEETKCVENKFDLQSQAKSHRNENDNANANADDKNCKGGGGAIVNDDILLSTNFAEGKVSVDKNGKLVVPVSMMDLNESPSSFRDDLSIHSGTSRISAPDSLSLILGVSDIADMTTLFINDNDNDNDNGNGNGNGNGNAAIVDGANLATFDSNVALDIEGVDIISELVTRANSNMSTARSPSYVEVEDKALDPINHVGVTTEIRNAEQKQIKDNNKMTTTNKKSLHSSNSVPSMRLGRKPPSEKLLKKLAEKEEKRKEENKKLKKVLLMRRAEEEMRKLEIADAKAAGMSIPPRVRLVSDSRNLPEFHANRTERIARKIITNVRSELSGGIADKVTAPLCHAEKILLESPFATPFTDLYKNKIEKEENKRKMEELFASVTDMGSQTNSNTNTKIGTGTGTGTGTNHILRKLPMHPHDNTNFGDANKHHRRSSLPAPLVNPLHGQYEGHINYKNPKGKIELKSQRM